MSIESPPEPSSPQVSEQASEQMPAQAASPIHKGESAPRYLGRVRAMLGVIVVMTIAMLAVGAMVTSIRSGDTDPTWNPHTAWEWVVNWIQARTDIGLRYELGHRIIGVVLGLLAIWLAFMTRGDARHLRSMVIWMILLLILQGTLGGVRVLVFSDDRVRQEILEWVYGYSQTDYDANQGFLDLGIYWRNVLAMGHGALAQFTFAFIVCCWVVSGRKWRALASKAAVKQAAPAGPALLLTLMLFGQLVLGTWVRQFGHQVDEGIAFHVAMALVIALYAALLGMHTSGLREVSPAVRRMARIVLFVTILQIFFGLAPWMITRGEVYVSHHTSIVSVLRVAHVLNGACLLASASVFWIVSRRVNRLARDA